MSDKKYYFGCGKCGYGCEQWNENAFYCRSCKRRYIIKDGDVFYHDDEDIKGDDKMTTEDEIDARIEALEELGKREYRLILTNSVLFAGWRDQLTWLKIAKGILEGKH